MKNNESGGVLIHRLGEFEFIFGFLKQNPKPTPFTEEVVLFDEELAGFKWTCPKKYQAAQLNQEITVGDVIKHRNDLQSLWIQPEKCCVELLNSREISAYFPRERIFTKRAEIEFLSETQPITDCPCNQSIVFYDSYGTQWLVNRKNVSKLNMAQVVYVPKEKRLEIKSDVYNMDELLLYLFEDYSELEWNDLTLAELVRLKNKVLHYTFKQDLPHFAKFSFKTYRKQDIVEWMNPAKFYFNEISE